MATFVPYLILILLLIVAVILVLGLVNMMRGGNTTLSQALMRYRVLAQLVAVVAMVIALFFFGR